MRSLIVLTLTVATFMLTACNSPQWPEPSRTTMNAWSVNEYQQASIDAGIVSQHTLYPHHFVRNSAELNELGLRDVCVLADHYKDNPGSLNVRRNGTPGDLYKQRLATVSGKLTELGVDTDRVRISNALPGGDGLASDRVLVILTEKMDQPLSEQSGVSTFENN